jgi:hypothetical protein
LKRSLLVQFLGTAIIAFVAGVVIGGYFIPSYPPGPIYHTGLTLIPPSCIFTGSLSSSSIVAGTPSVTVSGTDTCFRPGTTVDVFLDVYSAGCGGAFVSQPFVSSTTTDASGRFSQTIPTSSHSPGSYCVMLASPCEMPCTAPTNVDLPLTVTPNAGCSAVGPSGSNLQGANLAGANLQGCNMSTDNLQNANLQGANLQGADLNAATLSNADLRGADLTNANLSSATLSNAQVNSATKLGNTNFTRATCSGWPTPFPGTITPPGSDIDTDSSGPYSTGCP